MSFLMFNGMDMVSYIKVDLIRSTSLALASCLLPALKCKFFLRVFVVTTADCESKIGQQIIQQKSSEQKQVYESLFDL